MAKWCLTAMLLVLMLGFGAIMKRFLCKQSTEDAAAEAIEQLGGRLTREKTLPGTR